MDVAPSAAIPSAWKILVTGAAGFIGRHLCDRLCAPNLEAHATSRSERRAERPIRWQADLVALGAAQRLFATVKPDVAFPFVLGVGEKPWPRILSAAVSARRFCGLTMGAVK